jgi:hypothetical protein
MCRKHRDWDWDDDFVGGIRDRDKDVCTFRRGDFVCVCIRCPKTWR